MSNTENNYTETDLGNISLNPRGEYDHSAAYEYLDAVSYQGGSYFCLAELETTITGIAPDPGHNSEHWQMIALPGDMTPEYIAAHDDVINKAKQVETSRAVVELSQQEIESAHTDIQQLHSNTMQAAQEAENSRDSAAGYAQSAEKSRKAVAESEQNINAQITGFDGKVTESIAQAEAQIGSTRQQAIGTITDQQDISVNAVKTEGEKIITKVENDAKTVADDRASVEVAAQNVVDNAQAVAQNTQAVADNTASAAVSAESAKISADNAARSAKSVEDASKQIEQNKKDVASLKEDIGELNKVSKKILSVSIIQKCEVADGYYWNFIEGGKESKEINENYIAIKIPVEGNKLIVYGEFQDWASRYVNDGVYTPVENTYISRNTQTSKVAEFNNIPTDAKYLCLSFYKGGLDTSIESINVVSGEFRQNLSYRKTNFVDGLEVYTKYEVDDKLDKLGEIRINKIYVATTGSDTEGNGTKEKPYATVLKANDIITDASEKNKYEIIVADGTYTDLQEKYKGQNGSDYQGVIAKSYVTYKSESNNPEKCIFIWDGGVGYDTISNDTCTNKCFFHINSVTVNTVIKGFKFVGSNLRYCLHFESNCLTTPYIENCIFDWHGRDFSPKNGPVIGMGGCIFSHITFKDCKFLNSQNDAGIQWHDNTYPYDWMNGRYEPEGLCPKGTVIECIDCLFDNLNIQVRSQNEDRPMPCCLILKNCGGLKNVYPSIIAGGTKNYWKLFNQCSFIENDLLTDATETTTYDEMTSIKTSNN